MHSCCCLFWPVAVLRLLIQVLVFCGSPPFFDALTIVRITVPIWQRQAKKKRSHETCPIISGFYVESPEIWSNHPNS